MVPVALRPVPDRPAFFLAHSPDEGTVELVAEDATHAAGVLQLAAGDRCVGLDGRGGRWPLSVRAVHRGAVELEQDGPPEIVPEPGAEGAPLPWIEVAVAWPDETRAAALVRGLVQLGAAAITPLATGFPRPEPPAVTSPEHWLPIARAACKESRRAWLPELNASTAPTQLVSERTGAALAVLDPTAGLPLDTWLRSLVPAAAGIGTRLRPIVLIVGAEGGFAPEERDAQLAAGASPVRLGPHLVSAETAAIAALGVAVAIFATGGRA